MELVRPLTILQVDWKTFIDYCEDTIQISPTRNLDSENRSPKDASSFLASLDIFNTPKNNLRNRSRAFEHFFISFITRIDKFALYFLFKELDISIYPIEPDYNTRDFPTILSGTMLQWYSSILLGCKEEANHDVRIRMNACLVYLEQASFKEIWHAYTKKELSDGTFVLMRK